MVILVDSWRDLVYIVKHVFCFDNFYLEINLFGNNLEECDVFLI